MELDLTEASGGREVGQFTWEQVSYLCLSVSPSRKFSSQVKITRFFFLQKLTFWNNFCALGAILILFQYFFVSPRDTFMPNFKVLQQLWDKLEAFSHCDVVTCALKIRNRTQLVQVNTIIWFSEPQSTKASQLGKYRLALKGREGGQIDTLLLDHPAWDFAAAAGGSKGMSSDRYDDHQILSEPGYAL